MAFYILCHTQVQNLWEEKRKVVVQLNGRLVLFFHEVKINIYCYVFSFSFFLLYEVVVAEREKIEGTSFHHKNHK